MSDNHVNDYMGQGLSRLSKEKLVEIISDLQNMPHENNGECAGILQDVQ